MSKYVFLCTLILLLAITALSSANINLKALYLLEVLLLVWGAWVVRNHYCMKWLVVYLLAAIFIFDFASSLLIVKRQLLDGWYVIYPFIFIASILINQVFYILQKKYFNN